MCRIQATNRNYNFPRGMRGIYVLYRHRPKLKCYDVVYVEMARAGRRGGIRGRLISHKRRKRDLWTHFSVFEVWDNIRDDEVGELEGFFRHIYRRDTRANGLNVQRSFRKLRAIRKNKPGAWNANCGNVTGQATPGFTHPINHVTHF